MAEAVYSSRNIEEQIIAALYTSGNTNSFYTFVIQAFCLGLKTFYTRDFQAVFYHGHNCVKQ